jgi:hypothetical protein
MSAATLAHGTLKLFRNGAVGFINWLDHWAMIMCLSRRANPPDNKSASDQAKNEVKEQEPDIHIEEKGESRSSK